MASEVAKLIFEPHPGYGGIDPTDFEPLPFGYVSKEGPMPVFELRTLLRFPREYLNAVAHQMVAAPDMLAALKSLLELHIANHNAPEHAAARAAIAKATAS